MTSDDYPPLWLLPVMTGALLGVFALGIKNVSPPKSIKVVFFVIASTLILIAAALVPVAICFASPYWGCISLATFGAILAVTWPFFSFWILPAGLPGPRTHWEGRCQVCFIWFSMCLFTCLCLLVTAICLRTIVCFAP